jgi:DNA-binding beta-propeller fold protein YncE
VYAALLGGTVGVYDIDHGHRRVKVIDNLQLRGTGIDLRGLSANAKTHRLFLSYMSSSGGHIVCVDLLTDAVQWHRDYSPGVDRGDIGPEGDKLFVPSNENQMADYVLLVDPATGDVSGHVTVTTRSHDTDIGISGRFAYVETKSSSSIAVVDTATDQVVRNIGPFTGIVGPHAINGSDTLVVANVFGFFGFVIGNAETGQVVAQVPILATPDPGGTGLRQHGVAWKPDETEVWVTGGAYMHVFDMRSMPPREARLVSLPGYADTHWINFSIDGAYAYPSAGKNSGTPIDVIDTTSYASVATIDYSEDLVEVDFIDGVVTRVGDQFGIGRRP